MITLLPTPEREYFSSDSISKCIDTPNDVNILNTNNFPPHRLKLKIGAPMILLRNLNQSLGLCNGTRIILTQLGDSVLEGTIITGTHTGQKKHIYHV